MSEPAEGAASPADNAAEGELLSHESSDVILTGIMSLLDTTLDYFPEAALRMAQEQRAHIVPRLIEAIREATRQEAAGEPVTGNAHLFATFLLAEFEAREGLDAIVEAVSLPGEGPYNLYGDSVTEDMPRILAVLAEDKPELVDGLIANRNVSEYVRWSAVQALAYWVRDGRMTREEAVDQMRRHLRAAIDSEDREIVSPLVCELTDYFPREAAAEIDEAYDREWVDEDLISRSEYVRLLDEGLACMSSALDRLRPTRIEDCVEEMRDWNWSYDDEDDEGYEYEEEEVVDDEVEHAWSPRLNAKLSALEHVQDPDALTDSRYEAPQPVRRDGPRVGRNDPCPCGSGKKFKKCCGGRG